MAVTFAVALGACGSDEPADAGRAATAPEVDQDLAAEAEAAAAAREAEAEAKRVAAARRKAEAAKAERAEARDRSRGDALLESFIATGSRARWSIMHVGVEGGDVTVRTDLPPTNAPAFMGACTQLIDRQPWIQAIEVIGTDGASHASWARGDAACRGKG